MAIRFRLLGMAMMLGAAGTAPLPTGPVVLKSQPRTALDATARRVAAADLFDGTPGALLLIGTQTLGTAGTGPALFVQVQSSRSCGSAGCSVSVYLPNGNTYTKVLDAVGQIAVAPGVHRGMHDLLVGANDRWVWNGTAYADTLPAPKVDLRPRKHRTRAARHV